MKEENYKKVRTIFTQLGLSQIQFEIYLTLLSASNKLSAKEISEIINIPRTSIYHTVEHLIEMGLITQTIKGKSRKFSAGDPIMLDYIISNKIYNLDNEKKKYLSISHEIKSAIESLNQINVTENTIKNSSVEFYEGKQAVMNIHSLAINSREVRAYVNGAEVVKYFPGNNFMKFTNAAKNRKIEIWDIHQDTQQIREFLRANNLPQSYHIKLLPKDVSLKTMDYLIFDDSVAIIEAGQNFTVVIIKSESIYETTKTLHKLLWDLLPDPAKIP